MGQREVYVMRENKNKLLLFSSVFGYGISTLVMCLL